MKKKIVSILLVAAMTFGLAACGGGNDSGTEGGSNASVDTSTLKINLASEPDYLDPALNSSVDGGCLAVNSFVGLNTYDKDGNLIPAIASESTPSEDGTVYTFKLIESKWSNGDALTAKDFVYSWNRVADAATGADYAYLYDIIARNDDGTLKMEATDDYTLVVTLTSPCPYFLDLTAFPTFFPVHQASVEEADPDGTNPGAWAQEAEFVCNGAYTLKSWSHNESMVYVKNENYYDAENVTMDTLEFMLSADDTAIYAAYNSNDLDFIDTIPNDEIAAVINNDDFYIVDQLGTYYIGFNVNDPIFEGKTVEQANKMREAMSLMMDRSYIAEKIGQSGQIPADTFVPVGMADGNGGIFNTADDEWSYYDAETTGGTQAKAAMALLEEAGYTFTDNGDGTYACSPAISMTYLTNEGTAHEAIAQTIQMDFATIGIEMKIAVEEWNVFLDDRKKGNFTIAREGWVADYNDPVNMLEIFTSDSGNNDMQLGKAENSYAPEWSAYDALIDEIRTTADFEKRVTLMHQAEDMLMETYAVVPLYYYNDVYMQKDNVDGIISTVFGMKYFMYATKSAE
uniref:peptide ABC transporter substrate-binding protein n=1 Tax=Agathobacter sp. TaxID=2021311 RepID=UPI0040576377